MENTMNTAAQPAQNKAAAAGAAQNEMQALKEALRGAIQTTADDLLAQAYAAGQRSLMHKALKMVQEAQAAALQDYEDELRGHLGMVETTHEYAEQHNLGGYRDEVSVQVDIELELELEVDCTDVLDNCSPDLCIWKEAQLERWLATENAKND